MNDGLSGPVAHAAAALMNALIDKAMAKQHQHAAYCISDQSVTDAFGMMLKVSLVAPGVPRAK